MDARDHIGLALDRRSPSEGWQHALYIVVGRMPPTDRLSHLEDEVPDDSIEAPEGCVWEYRALSALSHQYRGAATSEIGYPDKLQYMLRKDGTWEVSEVFRAGRFATQADLVDDAELIEAIGGTSGASEIALGIEASPARASHWRATRDKIARCLFGNPTWEATLGAVLDEVESSSPEAEIVFAAFNPCDLIGSIINTVTGNDSMHRVLSFRS